MDLDKLEMNYPHEKTSSYYKMNMKQLLEDIHMMARGCLI
jgi:hypothetical protein